MSVFIKVQSNLCSSTCNKSKFFICLFKRNFADMSSDTDNIKFMENQDSSITQEREQIIDNLRNKSRLRPEHHNILFNKKPYSEPMRKHHLTVKYNRKMYGVYGIESGVNPGILWPTKDDIQTRREYEKVAYPFTIQEMVSAAEEEKEMKELELQQIHGRVVAKLAKLDLWKRELKEKIAKKEAEALAVKEKKDRLIEEVRRHFGFKVDPRDERFKEMLTLKEKEQKKKERQAKLEEKEKKAIARLMAKQE